MPRLDTLVAQPVAGVRIPQPRPSQAGQILGSGISQVGDVGLGIYQAEQRAKAHAAAASLALDLEAKVHELRDDPDYETAERRFAAFQAEATKKHGQGLQGAYRADFDQATAFSAQRYGLDVAEAVRLRRIDAGRASRKDALVKLAGLSARASDPVEREHYRSLALSGLADDVEGGLMSAQEAQDWSLDLERQIASAEIEEGIRNDPDAIYAALEDPAGPYHARLPEPERQAYLSQSLAASERKVAAEFARIQQGFALQREAERQDSRSAEEELLTMMAPSDLGYAPPEEIEARLHRLSPEAGVRWLKIAQNGGRFDGAPANVAPVYLDLESRSRAGDPSLIDGANAAYLEQLIDKPTRDALVDDSARARFKPARDWLDTVVKVRPQFGLAPSQEEIQREADAKVAFEGWVRANPAASDLEAMQKVREIAGQVSEAHGFTPLPTGTDPAALQADAFDRALQRAGFPPGTPMDVARGDPRFAQVAADVLLAQELSDIKKRAGSRVTP